MQTSVESLKSNQALHKSLSREGQSDPWPVRDEAFSAEGLFGVLKVLNIFNIRSADDLAVRNDEIFSHSPHYLRFAGPLPRVLPRSGSGHEKDTNLGSLGNPSGPISFFANLASVYILLASSKPTFLLLIILCTSRFACWSSPARESPAATLVERSKSVEVKPDSISLVKEEGSRV